MHYLTHFPYQMLNYGPLRHHSCFRFEAKHSLFKSFNYKNFKNLPYSIIERHQFWTLGRMIKWKNQINLHYKATRTLSRNEVHFALQFSNDPILLCEVLNTDGYHYRPGHFLINTDINLGSKLFRIKHIYLDREKIFFYCNEYIINNIDAIYNCLTLVPINKECLVDYKQLSFKLPQFSYIEDSFTSSVIIIIRYFCRKTC